MRNFLIVGIISLFLGACNNNPNLIATKYRIADVPSELYARCPDIGNLPAYSTLSDSQTARLIVQLYTNNKQCRSAILAIKSYLEKAKTIVDP